MTTPGTAVDQIMEQTFREESGRGLATLISSLCDFDLAEEALQEAFIAALKHWRATGIPRNPGAWSTTTASRKVIDRIRRDRTVARKTATLQTLAELELQEQEVSSVSAFTGERLKPIVTCCHPLLVMEAQVALTLRTLGGL